MEHIKKTVDDLEPDQLEIYLLATLLPPPVSLDVLCAITSLPPVTALQKVEKLVHSAFLSRCADRGAGYYCLAEYNDAQNFLKQIPESQLTSVAQRAIAGICTNMPDNAKRWMTLANIYQISQIPLAHTREMIKAGHYCFGLNLLVDAARYYKMALEAMEKTVLAPQEQREFVDAVLGLYTCRDASIFKDAPNRFLKKALDLSLALGNLEGIVKIELLMARAFFRTKQIDKAAQHLDRVDAVLAKHDFAPDVRLKVALTTSEFYFWRGYITKAIEHYESAIGSHEELPEEIETLTSCVRLGWTYGIHGETARGIGLIRAVCKKADELDAQDLKRYATLVLVIVLADAGRIAEGEAFLEQVFNLPEEALDHYTLWPGNGKRAYFAFCRGDYEEAFKYQDLAWQNSKALGSPHHRGADNIEIMLGLEERGMVHPEWNFDYDVERLLDWPDIYMQGVAYRFLALKGFRNQVSLEQVKKDLARGLSLLEEAGARIELAHAQILLARVLIQEDHINEAKKVLKSAWEIFSKNNPSLFPKDLKVFLDRTSKNALWVESLLEVGNALGSVKSRAELMSNIIRQAMRIAGAERGAIFSLNNSQLEPVATRNLDTAEIEAPSFKTQLNLVESVFESGRELVRVTQSEDSHIDKIVEDKGWTGCIPIAIKSRILGVIYLDRGPSELQLPEDEISLLRIISNQAAIALENMNTYEEIVDLNQELEAETNYYRESLELNAPQTQMIGRSKPFKKLLTLINQVADSDITVMITGETGVGKDVVAQAIHLNSHRSSQPFIAVNLVSLSPELIASELFGHEKGAFTGASQKRKGRFELASKGTLFLDDIDAFSLDIQAKMLRVLETKAFERVGGSQTLKTHFRLLAASNRNIEELVEQGLFRSDFYYRLNVFPIRVPPLRERHEDIPLLAHYFMRHFSSKFGKQFDSISKKDLTSLMDYHWPGNIRELRHVIERAVLLSENRRLVIPLLEPTSSLSSGSDDKILPLREMEAQYILKALNRCKGKVSGTGGAAELLELRPTTLYSKMKKLGIKRDMYTYDK